MKLSAGEIDLIIETGASGGYAARELAMEVKALRSALTAARIEGERRAPGAAEAFSALDIADRLIERAYGVDMPKEWRAAYRAVAKARALAKELTP